MSGAIADLVKALNEIQFLEVLIIAILAGIYGSMLGLGGGIILVPALIGLLNVEPRMAVAASIVAVIATSCAGAVAFVRARYANVELAVILETATAFGALTGTFLALKISGETVAGLFSVLLVYAAITLLRPPTSMAPKDVSSGAMRGAYFDKTINLEVVYEVVRLRLGMVAGFAAGNVSALLGVGGGLVMVPVMTSYMKVPLRAATATSNFMIGVTAVATAIPYYAFGDVKAPLAAPSAIGVLVGARLGSKLAPRTRTIYLKAAFSAVLFYTALAMARRAAWV
jgi:uncharacterized membrane protein YfcA